MKMDKEFKDFNGAVRLDQAKRDKLKTHRKSLRKRIRDHFAEKGWQKPSFASQGSFPLQTNVNPIRVKDDGGNWIEEYDLDDGVYFICPVEDREYAKTYHDRILEAVKGHTKEAQPKASCVRVIYSDGHHVDLPIYWIPKDGETPQIARSNQGYTDSDPKQFKEWVEARISASKNTGQLRRVIRYLKAWKNFQEVEDTNLMLPPGVTLTILACDNLVEAEDDDESFRETLRAIWQKLNDDFACHRPTTPTDENLLEPFSKQRVLKAFEKAVGHADEADDTETKSDACKAWRKVFGERFPMISDEASNLGEQKAFSSDPKFKGLWEKKELLSSGNAKTGTAGVIGTSGVGNLAHGFYGEEKIHTQE